MRASASTCTGRSAPRSARIATSTAMSGTSPSTRSASSRPSGARSPIWRRGRPGGRSTSIFFGGGTPSLMRPQTVGAILDAIARRLDGRAGRRGHARGQPDQRRGGALPGLSRGRRQPGLARRPGPERCRPAPARAHAFRRRGAGRRQGRAPRSSSASPSTSSTPARTRRRRRGARSSSEAIGHAAEHLSLYQLTIEPGTWFERLHRAGKLTVPSDDEARDPLRRDAGGLRGPRPAGLRDLEPRPARAPNPGTTSSTGATANMPAIGPGAHGRLVTGERAASPPRPRSIPRPGSTGSSAEGHGIVDEELLSAEAEGDEFLLMGLRLREGIDPTRYAAFAGRPLDEEPHPRPRRPRLSRPPRRRSASR